MNFSKKTLAAAAVSAAFLASVFFFQSCEKEDEIKPHRLELVSGDGQTGAQGELLKDEIRVRAFRPDGSVAAGYPIRVSARSGFALPENQSNFSAEFAPLSQTGAQSIAWSLGCDAEQWLDIVLLSPRCSQSELLQNQCDTLAVLSVRATASVQSGWVKSCGLAGLGNIFRENVRFRDGLNGEIFMLANNALFRSSNDGLEWDLIPPPSLFGSGMTDFAVAPNGDYWALTPFEGVFFSTDRGAIWQNTSSNGGITFSNGNRIWVDGQRVFVNFDFGQGLFRNVIGENFWKTIQPSGSFYNDFENLARASTGDLYIIDDYPKLYKSTNHGDTWTGVSVSSTQLGVSPVKNLQPTEDGKLIFHGLSSNVFYELDLATNASQRKTFSGTVGFLYRRSGKNYALSFDQATGGGTVYEGTGANLAPASIAGFDKGPIEAFFVTPSGKFVLATSTGVYALAN